MKRDKDVFHIPVPMPITVPNSNFLTSLGLAETHIGKYSEKSMTAESASIKPGLHVGRWQEGKTERRDKVLSSILLLPSGPCVSSERDAYVGDSLMWC